MPDELEAKIKIGKNGRLTVPIYMRGALGITTGKQVLIIAIPDPQDPRIVIKPTE